jgi:hypothetical protein
MKRKMALKFKSYKKINRHSRSKAKRRCAIGSINPNNELECTNIINLSIIDVFTIKSLKKICKVVWNYYNNDKRKYANEH